jgi:restriction system protein
MAIPDYQTLMLPMLEALADGASLRVVPEVTDLLATRFQLTEADREQLLPSGLGGLFVNRTAWAVTYLTKAGLIERPSRGVIRLTDRGREVLALKPAAVNNKLLEQFPEFQAFRKATRHAAEAKGGLNATDEQQNPEEHLYATYDALRSSVEADLLERLQSPAFPWESFEHLVVELLTAMGYGGSADEASRRVTKRVGDDGIDGVIDEDRLGLDAVYIQAKKYGSGNVVGRPTLQAFAGSLEGQRAAKGVFITTSHFSAEAHEYVSRITRRIVLIDGPMLARLMYDHGIGVRLRRSLDVKRVDEGYFEGEA